MDRRRRKPKESPLIEEENTKSQKNFREACHLKNFEDYTCPVSCGTAKAHFFGPKKCRPKPAPQQSLLGQARGPSSQLPSLDQSGEDDIYEEMAMLDLDREPGRKGL